MSASVTKPPEIGLVLTGGGARAAYQLGVIKAISEILGDRCEISPFQSIGGISAGAINSCFLAAKAGCFREGVEDAYQLWQDLRAEDILKTDVVSLTRLAARWMRDLGLGGVLKGTRSTHLLDTQPLRAMLEKRIDFKAIRRNIEAGILHGVGVTATNYRTGTAITFFDGHPSIEPWVRSSRLGARAELTLDHVLASASIPILFQPVRIQDTYYGDGSIRLRAPLSPVIHMGVRKVLAVGIRYLRPVDLTLELNVVTDMPQISIADIAGVMLNAAFMDSLESDVERMERINQTISLMAEEHRRQHPHKLRQIPLLVIRPSQDLGGFASEQFKHFPAMLRYLLKGIGASEKKGWDLLSYLAFDRAYTAKLLELGRADAFARRDEIVSFLAE